MRDFSGGIKRIGRLTGSARQARYPMQERERIPMSDSATTNRVSDEDFGYMKGLLGMKAALTVMDFASAETEQRYRSFYPVGEMLIGLRFNGDVALRTCAECGTVHPIAYSIFPWKDTEEEKAARALW